MPEKTLTAGVIGAGGLAGGELLRLLYQHPQVGEVLATSRSHSGKALAEVHPALRHLCDDAFSELSAKQLAARCDVLFLAMPHGQSNRLLAGLDADSLPHVIDLAADFRLHSKAAYQQYYGEHACFALGDHFVYGLPEAFKGQIETAKHIANPGCFATAAQLLLLPLAAENLLPTELAVFAVTGSSGSGIHPKAGTHHPFRAGNFYAYKPLAHQHEPEINETLSQLAGKPIAARLLAHSGPFVRGIAASAYANSAAFASLDVSAMYKKYYGETAPFVHVLDAPPKLAEVAGTNHVHVHVHQQGAELQLMLALDNLVKGAAGQAVQNMNLICGFAETLGLHHTGAYPC